MIIKTVTWQSSSKACVISDDVTGKRGTLYQTVKPLSQQPEIIHIKLP